jgi:RNA polymerase sigma-B factor
MSMTPTPAADLPPPSRSTPRPDQRSPSASRRFLGEADSRSLFVRWQHHQDQAAREELVKRFMPLARTLARRYNGAREPFEDLLQVASYGLLKSLDRFDPDRGTAFSSFAVPTILGELKRYFRDLGWSVHVPRGTQELAQRVRGAQEKLTTQTGRSPTVDGLAQYMELSVEEVLDGLEAAEAHHSTSLDVRCDDEDGDSRSLGDFYAVEEAGFEHVEDRMTVADALQELTPREREVLRLRFFEERAQTEVAKQIGVSQMQVSRIQHRAIARLRELSQREGVVVDRARASTNTGEEERNHGNPQRADSADAPPPWRRGQSPAGRQTAA